MKKVIIKLIELYRKYISAGTPPTCRFSPTCSMYAIEAVEKYGAARGGLLAVKRFFKCHPWGGGGYDPVP